jgi:hypothetical protein
VRQYGCCIYNIAIHSSKPAQELIYQKLKFLYFHASTLDMPDTASILRRHTLFSHMNVEALKKLLAAGRSHIFEDSQEIFQVDSTAIKILVIIRGTVKTKVTLLSS